MSSGRYPPTQLSGYHQQGLTASIQLQFLTAALKEQYSDPYPHDERPCIREEDGYPCNPGVGLFFDGSTALSNAVDVLTRETILKTGGIALADGSICQYSSRCGPLPTDTVWQYGAGVLIGDQASPYFELRNLYPVYKWYGRQVTSPALRWNDPESPQKIIDMCRALRNCRVHVNETGCLKVNIGHESGSFALKTIKRVATIIWLTDEAIFRLHAPWRGGTEYCSRLADRSSLVTDKTEVAWRVQTDHPISYESRYEETVANLPEDLDQAIAEPLHHIWMALNKVQIAFMMDPEYKGFDSDDEDEEQWTNSVAFRNFLCDVPGIRTANTFEFVQMASSLDPIHINHWISVCAALVNFARVSTDAEFKDLITEIVDKGNKYSPIDLLRTIGLSRSEWIFWMAKEAYYRAEPSRIEFFTDSSRFLFAPPITPNGSRTWIPSCMKEAYEDDEEAYDDDEEAYDDEEEPYRDDEDAYEADEEAYDDDQGPHNDDEDDYY